MDDRVFHITYVPSAPEPYYQFSGQEIQPRPVGEENGAVVFYYNPISAVNYVSILRFVSLELPITFTLAIRGERMHKSKKRRRLVDNNNRKKIICKIAHINFHTDYRYVVRVEYCLDT